jgi:glycolate oxidase iron-sulfur subunit
MSTSLPVIAEPLSVATPAKDVALELDPRTFRRGLSCVHCGLCLPACPTYTQNGNEADSPRGRIQLMLGLADGRLELTDTAHKHLDLCLDCRACESACPSGVVYHELIEEAKNKLQHQTGQGLKNRLLAWMFFHVFTHPTRLKLALLPARLLQKIGVYGVLRKIGLFKLLPSNFRKMEQMLTPDGPLWPRPLPPRSRAGGLKNLMIALDPRKVEQIKPKALVGFLPGCIGSVMFDKVNRQAVELLAACGADVVVPETQGCCGAIHHHSGDHDEAIDRAKRNIDAFLPQQGEQVDLIVSTIAGCGAMLREYDFLLRDDPEYRDRAVQFASKVRDISEVLLDLGMPEMKHAIDQTITYHDACHLIHAQKVSIPPRALLAKIAGLKMVTLPESDMCCGAAGTYNLTHPKMATDLAERKLNHIESTKTSTVVTGNVGCAMHIASEARARGRTLEVLHPVELLHRAVFGEEKA